MLDLLLSKFLLILSHLLLSQGGGNDILVLSNACHYAFQVRADLREKVRLCMSMSIYKKIRYKYDNMRGKIIQTYRSRSECAHPRARDQVSRRQDDHGHPEC